MKYILVTYGAGDLLDHIFNAIAALVNGKSGNLYQPLMRIGLILGLFWATISNLFSNQLRIISHWFLPTYLVLILFFAPTVTLIIKDPTSHQPPHVVDNVPFGLGMLAGTVSKIGDSLTRKIETNFSLPDDFKYHKTGSMMASNLIAESRMFKVTNHEVAETMKEFVNQCVVYDALMGKKYTLDELRKTDDIWKLVKENPSPARSFTFKSPDRNERAKIFTCSQGIIEIEKMLSQEVSNAFTTFGNKIFGIHENELSSGSLNPGQLLKQYLPGAFEHLTNWSKSASEVMKQQILIRSVVDAIESKSVALGNAPDFAVRRAYLQQRSNHETIGGVAGYTLIAMKNVIEALIYASFIFIIPLAMLPLGWRFVGQWITLLVWVQMWPPLYAILNYIMNVTARHQSMGITALVNGHGVTIANSVGLTNLNADMAAMAGFLTLSVHMLSYALVKGGASSFVSLASHLGGSTQAASSRAAEDLVSGNYNFGNLSDGNIQASNATFAQENWSPSYSSGSFSQNDGLIARTSSADGSQVISVANSNLRSSLKVSESLGSSYLQQANMAATASENAMVSAAESLGSAYNDYLEFGKHQSQQQSMNQSHSLNENTAVSKDAQEAYQLAEKFAKDNHLSVKDAAQLMGAVNVGGSVDLKFLRFGADVNERIYTEAGRNEMFQKAKDFSEQHHFNERFSNAVQATKEDRLGTSDDEGKRYAEGMRSSYDQSQQYRDEASVQLQKSKSYADSASFVQQNSGMIESSLNQEFVDTLPTLPLPGQSTPMGRREAEIILSSRPELAMAYGKRFVEKKMQELPNYLVNHPIQSMEGVGTAFESSKVSISPSVSSYNEKVQKVGETSGFGQEFFKDKNLKEKVGNLMQEQDQKINSMEEHTKQQGKTHKNKVEEGKDQSILTEQLSSVSSLLGSINIKKE
ncbi:MAG: conjugal transfer protein TraG N-terminal domain-containing protein [Alphaproteobacteria bacterium]|nr:conjugal transfer protein TraG N-terminal domain-containing protein [Alphaproteobacteria bacterium]